MKIYTYYENINFKKQNELLDLWKTSWENMGFEAVVLSSKDAKLSEDYDEFCKKMQFIFKQITGKNLGRYGLSCFVRWLAYSNIQNDGSRFFVSDYDVINSGKFTPYDPTLDKLHFYDADCPCFAFGNPIEFSNLCDAFFDVTMQRLQTLKQKANHYHDQEFFMYNFISKNNPGAPFLLEKYNMFLSRNRDRDIAPLVPEKDQESVRAFHISHHNTRMIKNKNPKNYHNQDLNDIRISIVKNILS